MIPYTGGESGGMGPGPPFPFIRNQQHHHHHRNQQHHQQHQQQQQLTRALSLGNNRHSFMDARGYHTAHPPLHRQQHQQHQLQHHKQQLQQQKQQQPLKKQLSAKELTGAPLISYVPRNRKIKKKISEPNLRSRHCSQPSFYQGQNLYRNIQIQDFYQNPIYAMQTKPVFLSQAQKIRRESMVSTDTLSDSYSISSDDLENFVPRIIRPRRRRKKDKKEKKPTNEEEKDETCLGSEKQWLPQGLLSAESSFDSRSESGSSEEDNPIVRRKLGPALSMPVYPFYQNPLMGGLYGGGAGAPTSDYCSLNSNSSDTPPSSSTDHLCDSDSSRSESEQTKAASFGLDSATKPGFGLDSATKPGFGLDSATKPGFGLDPVAKPALKQTKSISSSFFRSPKMAAKQESKDDKTKRILRKTNSWHPAPNTDESRASFSLFSPAGSIDLLSGIRKNLSKLELNSDEE